MTQLITLGLDGNPLTTLILSETLAARNLAAALTILRNKGVSVFAYPLAVQLSTPRLTATARFEFTLSGPPGIYTVLASSNLVAWSEVGRLTNDFGSATFTDTTSSLIQQKFYRAQR
jgi:hypothetical protein